MLNPTKINPHSTAHVTSENAPMHENNTTDGFLIGPNVKGQKFEEGLIDQIQPTPLIRNGNTFLHFDKRNQRKG